MSSRALLSVKDLRVGFATEGGRLQAVDGVGFDLSPGEVLAIVGESGSGKSVTAQTILGLTRSPNATIEGSVHLGETELLQASESELRKVRGERIGMVFQDPMTSFNPVYRVGTQIIEAIRAHRDDVSKDAAHARAVELLDSVGIPDAARRVDDYPHEFSGGMRQRAMIAMALALEPEVLIADEPTTALDVTIQAQILRLLESLNRERNLATILITHDLGVVAEVADRVMVMYAGRVVEEGTLDEIFYDPQHPYTWGLLGSLSRLDRPRPQRLPQISGAPPSLIALPVGCAFRPRCPHEFGKCSEQPPLEAKLPDAPSHRDRCWLTPEQKAGGPPGRRADRAGGAGLMTSGDPLVEVTDLVKHFPIKAGLLIDREIDQVRAVDGISFSVTSGQTLGLVGESGSGKSTACRALLQLLQPTSGSVRFEGQEIAGLSRRQMRPLRRQMQMIFQDPYASLNPRQRIGQIVGSPLKLQGIASGSELRKQVQELLERVGLSPEHYDRYPHEFSGGQRQRIGIARAIALKPKLIVADEPVSALDVSIQAQIVNLLDDLQDELGLTYVFVAHDIGVVRHISDRIAVMHDGKIVEQGTADQVCEHPTDAYTKKLLAAVPIPDPRESRARRQRAASAP